MTTNGKMIENDHGNRWSRGCPMDDEFSGFYVIDGIKSKMHFQLNNECSTIFNFS